MLERFIKSLGSMGIFAGSAVAASVKGPSIRHETALQMELTFRRCILPVTAVLVPLGAVVSLQGLLIFRIFGAEPLVSSLVAASVLRELSPGIASLMVAAQAGSSMAAELGAMRVKEEIDAQEVMGVNPLSYLVMPRLLAGTLMTPMLNLVGCVGGLFGGYLIAVCGNGVTHGAFMANLYNFLRPADLWQGVVKATVFGAIISLVSCYNGFHVKGGAAGVGTAANRSVVQSIVAILVANYFLTSAFFGLSG